MAIARLSINASTGAITGTPSAAGTSNFTVQVQSAGDGQTDTQATSITILAGLAITTTTLPGETVGTAYNQTLGYTGGDGNNTWSISAGVLPTGLSINATTGAITGTPSAAVKLNVPAADGRHHGHAVGRGDVQLHGRGGLG